MTKFSINLNEENPSKGTFVKLEPVIKFNERP